VIVGVGGTGEKVAVGGTGVSVGGTGVDVGGTAVGGTAVGGTGVGVGVAAGAQAAKVNMINTPSSKNRVRFIIRLLSIT
jgi:hypothetical protein